MLNWIIKSTAHVNTCRITVVIVFTESTYASRIGITYSTILHWQAAQIALLASLLHQKQLHYPKLHLCKHCTRRQHKEHHYNIFHSWIVFVWSDTVPKNLSVWSDTVRIVCTCARLKTWLSIYGEKKWPVISGLF